MTAQWPVQDAKAHFSQLIETCLVDGPQVITKRGRETAVVVSMEHWRRSKPEAPTLKDLLLSPEGRFDIELPTRGRLPHRSPAAL